MNFPQVVIRPFLGDHYWAPVAFTQGSTFVTRGSLQTSQMILLGQGQGYCNKYLGTLGEASADWSMGHILQAPVAKVSPLAIIWSCPCSREITVAGILC